jgi:transcription initiation factor TFIIIB Brf1 subunit/transcription initiation factor TFIIB
MNIKKNIEDDEDVWNMYLKIKESFTQVVEQKEDENSCRNCKKKTLSFELESIVCTTCGCQNGLNISKSHEWKDYDKSASVSESRCGMPINPLLPRSSMSTIILGSGNEFLRRLARWNDTVYKEKSLLEVFNRIAVACKHGGLPKIIENKATHLYKIFSENVIKRGVSRTAVIAACVYFSCLDYSLKNKKFAQTQSEICTVFKINKKQFTKGLKCFYHIMSLKSNVNVSKFLETIKPKGVGHYIKLFFKKIEIKFDIENILKTSENVEKIGIISENTPCSIAISCIYLYTAEGKTKQELIKYRKQISKECDISEVTILKAYKILKIWKKFLIIS